MVAGGREVEIKLPFASAADATKRLLALGARRVRDREFEDNVLYDFPTRELRLSGRLLRLRRSGTRALLTFKGPVEGEFRHKVRAEHETEVSDPDALARALEGLGLFPQYRYQKYRTTFEVEGLEACVDETPVGCYVELEGDAAAIDRAAARLGFGPEAYVLATYRELHEQAARARGEAPGDLVFPERPIR